MPQQIPALAIETIPVLGAALYVIRRTLADFPRAVDGKWTLRFKFHILEYSKALKD